MDPQQAALIYNFLNVLEGEEYEMMIMQYAAVAALELVAMEEDEEVDYEAVWVPVTVVINDFHNLGDPCFKIHFRMSRTVFEALTTTVFNHLVVKGRLKRERTPMQDILLMVVWLLATPDSFRSVALRFGVNPGTLYYFYLYVIQALRELAPEFITWPNAAERVVISEAFQELSGFPGIIGCIDCTHIQITAPLEESGRYVNRHHVYSINVQSVADNNMLVRQLHVGEAGSLHDRRIFRRSPLLRDLLLEPAGVYRTVHEHLVGDGGYGISDFMMIPFVDNGHLTPAQSTFNSKLSQCRVKVENSYALVKGKWRRLKMLYARRPDVVTDHITASFVLHNFILLNGEPYEKGSEGRLDRNEPDEANGEDDEEEDYGIDAMLEECAQRGLEKRIHIMNMLQAI
ncbi:Putative nuclease [Frankliniella fusca]|uniref:Nuclease n=1 Tax=Frankliniella fusca TaxID=407009 RepID=A0AAE1GYP8_9NEOP|nr:Putative nuclease [Frankliniella fusca]